jgi:hypothetical protein
MMHKKLVLTLLLFTFSSPVWALNMIMIFFDSSNNGCPTYTRDNTNGGNAARCPAAGTQHSDAACRSAGDTITWNSNGTDYKIVGFPYTVTAGAGNQKSATIPAGTTDQVIKYQVTNADGTCILDPRIIIGNPDVIDLNGSDMKQYKIQEASD